MKQMLKILLAVLLFVSCSKQSALSGRIDDLEGRVSDLETMVSKANSQAIALSKFVRGNILISSFEKTSAGYELKLSDGSSVDVIYGASSGQGVPLLAISEEGWWMYSYDGRSFEKVEGADNVHVGDARTPVLSVDEQTYWIVSLDGGMSWQRLKDSQGNYVSSNGAVQSGYAGFFSDVVYDESASELVFTLRNGVSVNVPVCKDILLEIKGLVESESFYLNELRQYDLQTKGVRDVIIEAPDGWRIVFEDNICSIQAPSSGETGPVDINLLVVSDKGLLFTRNLRLSLLSQDIGTAGCKAWRDYSSGSSSNMLLDFSYAGYNHGESAPGDVSAFGWTVYDVTQYGAVPNDGLSDREAFVRAVEAALGGAAQKPSAKAVIYFPAGEYILHTAADNTGSLSNTLLVRAGDIVLKGAGRDRTTLVMQDPNLPASEALYSSPAMLEFKHQTGLSKLADVASDAAQGTFSVGVGAGAEAVGEGSWVCLVLKNNDMELIAEELYPYNWESGMTDLSEDGVKVYEYHQVKSNTGGVMTFYEPILHAVESKWGWEIHQYPHYENVGIEDLTFRGNAKSDFVHHGSWEDDGAYKPVNMIRIVNGWMRRVGFTSVSEACTLTNCANVSVYDISIDGNRGHASIRSQQSSRAFIGKVMDSSGDGKGQYHATGVSKPSIGTVLWRNQWGSDACFEAHATQPRATLVDCCKGGWMYSRQGGDESQVPNHLSDLTIWNFESTTAFDGSWIWWNAASKWWKFLPPVIVGFHGAACSFDQIQVRMDADHGTVVAPESLYEAQLRKRLGYVPSWLNSIK